MRPVSGKCPVQKNRPAAPSAARIVSRDVFFAALLESGGFEQVPLEKRAGWSKTVFTENGRQTVRYHPSGEQPPKPEVAAPSAFNPWFSRTKAKKTSEENQAASSAVRSSSGGSAKRISPVSMLNEICEQVDHHRAASVCRRLLDARYESRLDPTPINGGLSMLACQRLAVHSASQLKDLSTDRTAPLVFELCSLVSAIQFLDGDHWPAHLIQIAGELKSGPVQVAKRITETLARYNDDSQAGQALDKMRKFIANAHKGPVSPSISVTS